MFDKRLSLVGATVLACFMVITLWLLHLRHKDLPVEEVEVLVGDFRLLRSENLSLERQPYRIEQLPPDDWHQLINLTDFTFTMNDPSTLCNVSNSPIVLAIVHSAPCNFQNRRAIRTTWGRDLNVVFLIGETDNKTQAKLYDENAKYNDMVQGSFVDTYRNLTYKHVMGLKWVTYYCRSARYILKLDDDVFVNSRNLNDLIVRHLSPLGARRLVICNAIGSCAAKRTYRSKWRVTPAEYAGRWYPKYCPGWGVLYSPDVVFALYREAQRSPYFWIDDVHITGTLLAQANFSHTEFTRGNSHLWSDSKKLLNTRREEFIVGLTSYEEFYNLWDKLVS